MSLHLEKHNSMIHHIPRTRGMYTRELLKANGIPFGIKGEGNNDKISPIEKESECVPMHRIPRKADFYPGLEHKLVIIRDPITWYRSLWHVRVYGTGPGPWDGGRREFDRKCHDSNYETFIDKVCFFYPFGFLTQVAAEYMKESTTYALFENYEKHLTAFLRLITKDPELEVKFPPKMINARQLKKDAPPPPDVPERVNWRIKVLERDLYTAFYNKESLC